MDNPTPQDQTPNGSEWISQIPEEQKEAGYWKPLADKPLKEVLKAYGNAQEMIGRSLHMPDKPLDDPAWDKIYGQLGRPEKSDGYEFTPPNIEGFQFLEEDVKEFKDTVHKLRLTKAQAEGVSSWWNEKMEKQVNTSHNEFNNDAAVVQNKLQLELGANYDVEMAFAKRAASHFFGETDGPEIFKAGLNSESAMKGFIRMGDTLKEHKIFGENPPELSGVLTRDQALDKIKEVKSNRDHPYWHKTHSSEREAARGEMQKWFQLAYPSQV